MSNKVVRRLHHTTVSRLVFPDFKITENCLILSFSDASLNNLANGGTQAGFLVFLVDLKTLKLSILYWKSSRMHWILPSCPKKSSRTYMATV